MKLPDGIFSKTPFTVKDILLECKIQNIQIEEKDIINKLNELIDEEWFLNIMIIKLMNIIMIMLLQANFYKIINI